VWNNLVALEAGLDRLQARPALQAADIDLDGARSFSPTPANCR
jgi:hypothetical protein